MWLVYSLFAPFFFAIVHVLDSYCVEDIFERPWMGMVTSAFASLIVFAPLPYILPFVDWSWPAWNIILLALLAGALIQLSQGLYFQALSYSEAGIVAAYWNMVPAMLPLLSFTILHQILSLSEYTGILILIVASTFVLLIDTNLKFRITSFILMTIASFMQASAYLLLDYAYKFIPFLQAFLIMTVGLIVIGISPLLIKRVRQIFINSVNTLNNIRRLIISIEFFNLLGLAAAQKAVSLGNPSLVAAVETTIPAFAFAISISFLSFRKTALFGDPKSYYNLPLKILTIIIMCIGVWIVS